MRLAHVPIIAAVEEDMAEEEKVAVEGDMAEEGMVAVEEDMVVAEEATEGVTDENERRLIS
jgi:hypothetical protein